MNIRAARHGVVTLLFLLLFSIASISADIGVSNGNLSPAQAAALIKQQKQNTEFVILDVRTPAEFQQGHIKNAVLIDFRASTFVDRIKELDRNKLYLVYCRSGNRSQQAADIMVRLGFLRVINMSGGFNDWVSNGLSYTF